MKKILTTNGWAKLRKKARTIKQERYDRAVHNSMHDGFNEKFRHPRSNRINTKQPSAAREKKGN